MNKQKRCSICGDEPRHHYADKARSCLNKLNQLQPLESFNEP